MAEGTYEYECNRAELLGINPPSKEKWEEKAERVREEKEQAEKMTEIAIQDEAINESKSKMDEITNILSVTQMRLNKFKRVCGSLTHLLKIKTGDAADPSESSDIGDEEQANAELRKPVATTSTSGGAATRKQDMQQKMSSGIDKLDALLTKTENAQNSMAHQTKQMKTFLK